MEVARVPGFLSTRLRSERCRYLEVAACYTVLCPRFSDVGSLIVKRDGFAFAHQVVVLTHAFTLEIAIQEPVGW